MTTIRGTVKNGQLTFPAEVTAQLGLLEGEAIEVTDTVILAAKIQKSENLFSAWIGSLPPLPEGQDAVGFIRQLRGTDEDNG